MANLPIEEFVDLGLLQEVNRRFFHPIGMELLVRFDQDTNDFSLVGIADHRGVPEGLVLGDGHQPANPGPAAKYDSMLKSTSRMIAYGYVVQPVEPLEPVVVQSVETGKPMPREIKGGG